MAIMETHHCPDCFIEYAAPAALFEARRKDGKPFYCPNGHNLHYGDNENDRTRRERDRLKQQMAEKDDELRRVRERRDEEMRSHAATRGHLTRIRKRAANGVCPCCTRSFTDLRRHMADKHPQFRAEHVEAA